MKQTYILLPSSAASESRIAIIPTVFVNSSFQVAQSEIEETKTDETVDESALAANPEEV